jgi:hypothetical protein
MYKHRAKYKNERKCDCGPWKFAHGRPGFRGMRLNTVVVEHFAKKIRDIWIR